MTDIEIARGMFEAYMIQKPYAQFEAFVGALKTSKNSVMIESIEAGITTIIESLTNQYSDVLKYYGKYTPEQVKTAFEKGNTDLLKWWGVAQIIYYLDGYGKKFNIDDEKILLAYDEMVKRWVGSEGKKPFYLTYNDKEITKGESYSPSTFVKTFCAKYASHLIGNAISRVIVAKWIKGNNYTVTITADGDIKPTMTSVPDVGIFKRILPENTSIKRNKNGKIVKIENGGIPIELRDTEPQNLPEYWVKISDRTRNLNAGDVSLNKQVRGGGNTSGDVDNDSTESRVVSKDIRELPEDNKAKNKLFKMLDKYATDRDLKSNQKEYLEARLANLRNTANKTPLSNLAEDYGMPLSRANGLWDRFKVFIAREHEETLNAIKSNQDDTSFTTQVDELGNEQQSTDSTENDETEDNEDNEDIYGEMMADRFGNGLRKQGYFDD